MLGKWIAFFLLNDAIEASQVSPVVKNLPSRAEDTRYLGLIPGLGKSSGGGNNSPLQCSCLENSTDRGALWTTVHGVTKSQTQFEQHVHMHKLLEQIIFSSLIKPESDFRKLDYLRDVGRLFLKIIKNFLNGFILLGKRLFKFCDALQFSEVLHTWFCIILESPLFPVYLCIAPPV